MSRVHIYRRLNGRAPYEEYLAQVSKSGRKVDEAKIRAFVRKLAEVGSHSMVTRKWAEKLNNVWQLRPRRHRILYFWHSESETYVLLNGFLKATPKTPPEEIDQGERLRDEYLTRISRRKTRD